MSLFIIRHCDKDSANGCTDQGYARAKLWGQFFAKKNLNSPLYYAFGFKIKDCDNKKNSTRQNTCPQDIDSTAIVDATKHNCKNFNYKGCSSSQRAFLTACGATGAAGKAEVITEFCVGEEDKLIEDIYSVSKSGNDVVVCWEHEGIIDILNALAKKFGSPITFDPWAKKESNDYNLIFIVPLNTTTMPAITVRCVAMGLEGDVESCNETPDWVKKIDSTATPSTWIISDSNVRAMQQHEQQQHEQQQQPQQQQQQCSSCGNGSFWKKFVTIYIIIMIIIITVLIFTVLQ